MFFHFHPSFLYDSISFSNRSVLIFPSLPVHRKEIRENEIKKEGVLELPSYFTFFFIAFSALLRLFWKRRSVRQGTLWEEESSCGDREARKWEKVAIEFTISMSWIAWEFREEDSCSFFLSHLTSGFEVALSFFGKEACFRLLRFLFLVFLFFIHIRLYFRFADFLFILRHRMCLICQCLCTLLLLLLCYSASPSSSSFLERDRETETEKERNALPSSLYYIPSLHSFLRKRSIKRKEVTKRLYFTLFLKSYIFCLQALFYLSHRFYSWISTASFFENKPTQGEDSSLLSLHSSCSKIHWKMKRRVSRMRKMIWKQERRLKDKNVFLLNANPFMFYFPHFHLHLISCPRPTSVLLLLSWFFLPLPSLSLFHSFMSWHSFCRLLQYHHKRRLNLWFKFTLVMQLRWLRKFKENVVLSSKTRFPAVASPFTLASMIYSATFDTLYAVVVVVVVMEDDVKK